MPRSRRTVAAVLLVMVVAGCSPGDEAAEIPEPAAVDDCDGLVDVGIQLVRAYVDVVEQLRIDTLTAEELPPELVQLESVGADLDAKVVTLQCDAAELNARIAEEVEGIESDSTAAQLLLQLVAQGMMIDPAPVTSTTTAATSTTVP